MSEFDDGNFKPEKIKAELFDLITPRNEKRAPSESIMSDDASPSALATVMERLNHGNFRINYKDEPLQYREFVAAVKKDLGKILRYKNKFTQEDVATIDTMQTAFVSIFQFIEKQDDPNNYTTDNLSNAAQIQCRHILTTLDDLQDHINTHKLTSAVEQAIDVGDPLAEGTAKWVTKTSPFNKTLIYHVKKALATIGDEEILTSSKATKVINDFEWRSRHLIQQCEKNEISKENLDKARKTCTKELLKLRENLFKDQLIAPDDKSEVLLAISQYNDNLVSVRDRLNEIKDLDGVMQDEQAQFACEYIGEVLQSLDALQQTISPDKDSKPKFRGNIRTNF